jgi:hypothetical protein
MGGACPGKCVTTELEAVQKQTFGQPYPKNTLPKAPKSDFNADFGSLASQNLHNFNPLVPSAD